MSFYEHVRGSKSLRMTQGQPPNRFPTGNFFTQGLLEAWELRLSRVPVLFPICARASTSQHQSELSVPETQLGKSRGIAAPNIPVPLTNVPPYPVSEGRPA